MYDSQKDDVHTRYARLCIELDEIKMMRLKKRRTTTTKKVSLRTCFAVKKKKNTLQKS